MVSAEKRESRADAHCTKGVSFVKILGSFGPAYNC